jgi:transposase
VKGAASVPAATRGFDGGKKVNGRKRHIVVDTLGLLLTVMVTAASVTDRDAGRTLLARLRERHWRITLVWANGGYTGRLVDVTRDILAIALSVVRRTDGTTGFVVLPKRWLVERTFAWLMRSRRLARDYEARTDTAEAMIRWSMTMVMSRRLARRPR